MRWSLEDERRAGGVAVLGLVGLLVLAVGAISSDRDRGPERFELVFDDAGAILDGSDVKVAGVRAGTVRGLEIEDGQAVVTIGLDPEFLPLREDAGVTIRPVSLLGERYLDLDTGSSGEVLPPGSRIGPDGNGLAVELDEVLNTLDDPTAAAVASIVSTFGSGLAGRGEDAAEVIEMLAPALERTDELAAILDEQSDVLEELVAATAPVAAAVADDEGERLDALVSSATEVLEVTARRQEMLASTIERLPETIVTARTSLAEVADLSGTASRTLEDVQPVTEDLVTLADELGTFADDATPALAGLDSVLDHAEELLAELRPIVATLEPAGDDLTAITGAAEPIVSSLTRDREGVWDFFRNWALVTNGSDGVSHYFRAIAMVGPLSAPGVVELPGLGGEGRGPVADGEGDGSPGDPPRSSSATELLEGLPSVVGGLLGGLGSRDGSDAALVGQSAASGDGTSVTGLDEAQERSLLGVLLGRSG